MKSEPTVVYGIHQATLYNPLTGMPFGDIRSLKEGSFTTSGETVENIGGSAKFPFAIEDGALSAELSIKAGQVENFMIENLLGKAPTEVAADTAGAVDGYDNVSGSSVKDAATGIASATVKAASKADLKYGKYLIQAVSPTTVDVFALTDVDFSRGTDLSYQDDKLKITASPLTITGTGGVTEIPSLGVELTGGSGTVAMTAGDTAEFFVKPPSTKSSSVVVGGLNDVFPEFGCVLVAQRRSNDKMFMIDIFRAKGIGLPFPLTEKAFLETEITAKCMYDSTKQGVFKIDQIESSMTVENTLSNICPVPAEFYLAQKDKTYTLREMSLYDISWLTEKYGVDPGTVARGSDLITICKFVYRLMSDEDRMEFKAKDALDDDGEPTVRVTGPEVLAMHINVNEIESVTKAYLKAFGISQPILDQLEIDQVEKAVKKKRRQRRLV